MTYRLENHLTIKNKNRFRLGQLIPDAILRTDHDHSVSHFKVACKDYKHKMIDFRAFYQAYRDHILQDDLYMGYLLHLIADGCYREFMINHRQVNQENSRKIVEEIHNDYRLLNHYFINKYQLKADVVLPDKLQRESLYKTYDYKALDLIRDLGEDFVLHGQGDCIHLTPGLMEDYMNQAIDLSLQAYNQIVQGYLDLDPEDFAWPSQ